MHHIFMDYGADRMSEKQLRAAIKREEKKARAYRDKHGPLCGNPAADKVAAYKFELVRRYM